MESENEMIEMIEYENVTVNQYINAKWKKDISYLSPENLEYVETQYIDTAELYESEEFTKVGYIEYLNNRKNSIELAIRLQRMFVEEFGVPYIPKIEFFKKFGHNVYWKDKESFEEQLRKIESKEKKYTSKLENSIKELIDLRAKKKKGTPPKPQTRGGFVNTLISLGKCGYQINRNETTLEDIAYMIKKQSDEAKEYASKNKKK